MEQVLMNILKEGLTLDALLALLQLILVAFMILWLRGWILSTWAWHKFKNSTVIADGTKISVTINGTRVIRGELISANKKNITVGNDTDRAIIKTRKFMSGDYDWLLHI